MTCPIFRKEIEKFDVNIFQETHLFEGGLEHVDAVRGYSRMSVERQYDVTPRKPYGGVAVLAREGLKMQKNDVLTSTDILVVENDDLVIVAAYILPETSSWEAFADDSPADKLMHLMAALEDDSRAVLIMGDLNARTASDSGVENQPRASDDDKTSTRGSTLLRTCRQHGYQVFNGLPCFQPGSSGCTSRGKAVVDYVIGNVDALSRADSLAVREGSGGGRWKSDHKELALTLRTTTAPDKEILYDEHGRRVRKRKRRLPDETLLDKLLIRAVNSVLTDEEKMRRLYGPVLVVGAPVQVYVDGSCFEYGTPRARAGSGVFFGPGNRKNMALRVPGAQTNNRGEAYAVLRALIACDNHAAVTIYSDSEWTISTVAIWAGKRAAMEWKMPHGDIFSDIAWVIKSRPAPVDFKKVRAHSGNAHNDGADNLAKEGANLPGVPTYERMNRSRPPWNVCSCNVCQGRGEVLRLDKVRTTLVVAEKRRSTIARPAAVTSGGALTARSLEGMDQQLHIRTSIFLAPTRRLLWKRVNLLRNPRAVKELFFLPSALARTFYGRMNRALPAPETFDLKRRRLNELLIELLPAVTADTTPEQFFSRPFTVKEVVEAKEKIKKRDGAAPGGDRITYGDVLEMDNDALLDLCNACLESGRSPTVWVQTILVGLCKKGKAKEDPNSYRTIGLESCMLKFMTLLVTERLTLWATNRKIIPPSQNGFRAGYRTNNNMFILEAAKAKARSLRKPLYVAYVDMTNAFPSTDHATLWRKLIKLGAGGKIFDWLRHLYEDMRYVVLHGDGESDPFESDMGILIGDTCSPILWALYMSDLPRFVDVGDGRLLIDDVLVGSLEQADDILLLSTTPGGLQRRLEGVAAWCRVNFMEINESKSVTMVFSSQPVGAYPFTVCGAPIKMVKRQVYIGFHVSSEKLGVTLHDHYAAKANHAESMVNTIWGLEQKLGGLPVDAAVEFYKLLVMPHLTHGCDVALDTAQDRLKPLAKVELSFCRHLLSLGKRGAKVVTWTELGWLPIRYIRLIENLKSLLHIAKLPRDRWVWKALKEHINVDFRGRPSWVGDLRKVLKSLPFPVKCPSHEQLTDPRTIESLISAVRSGAHSVIQREFDLTRKLYLLHGRVEPRGEGKRPGIITLKLRDYLLVPNDNHRKALTRVLTCAHSMACEVYQYAKRAVEWKDRVCRYGCAEVETPEHIWLQCQGDGRLCELRRKFQLQLTKVCSEDELANLLNLDHDCTQQMRFLVGMTDCVSVVAEYAYEVERNLKLTPLEWR